MPVYIYICGKNILLYFGEYNILQLHTYMYVKA